MTSVCLALSNLQRTFCFLIPEQRTNTSSSSITHQGVIISSRKTLKISKSFCVKENLYWLAKQLYSFLV